MARYFQIAFRVFLAFLLPFALLFLALFFDFFGKHQDLGKIEPIQAPYYNSSIESSNNKKILFGDLHVHTTYSLDAFVGNLPILEGEGAHPVADACNFARFCANLDFFSVTDHAEFLTKREWDETIESLRNCSLLSK